MRIENMEQRVANTPAVLLCDECDNKSICKWADKMRDFVVTADKAKADTPFSYIPCCPYYGQSNETTQFQKDYAEEHPVYAYDLDHGIMTRKGYMPMPRTVDNLNYIQKKVNELAENTSATYVRDAVTEVPHDKEDNV